MLKENDFSRLELKLSACRDNYRYFRSLLEPSTKLLVLVKANAYGQDQRGSRLQMQVFQCQVLFPFCYILLSLRRGSVYG